MVVLENFIFYFKSNRDYVILDAEVSVPLSTNET